MKSKLEIVARNKTIQKLKNIYQMLFALFYWLFTSMLKFWYLQMKK